MDLLDEISLNLIPRGVSVKPAKLNDVNNLLTKHYGDGWQDLENLSYYKNVLDRSRRDDIPAEDNDGDSTIDPGDVDNEEVIDFV